MKYDYISEEDKELRAKIKEKIKSFNNKVSKDHLLSREEGYVKHYSIQVHDHEEFVGGITTRLYWECMEVDDLFIEEKYRHHNVGTRLLKQVIDEAKKLKKSFVLLSTFSFQALEFYTRFGFYIIGEIKDYPKGHTLFTLRLDL